ncbi:hypothetical protein HZ994_13325 [Akkermansiaceae bacterium]|nr:hypothetical protein HZ994_13325 [Akkermansiaceae bacterium]
MKVFAPLVASLFAIPQLCCAERAEHAGCYADWSEKELTIGNALVERKWTIKDGLLTAVSFKDKASG